MPHLNETSSDDTLWLLDTIFSGIDPKEKIRVMEDDFGIPVEPAMEREVNNMGGYGDVVFERGVKRGIEQGVDKGRVESIEALMRKMNLSVNEAMDLLEIPKDDQQRYLSILKPQCV